MEKSFINMIKYVLPVLVAWFVLRGVDIISSLWAGLAFSLFLVPGFFFSEGDVFERAALSLGMTMVLFIPAILISNLLLNLSLDFAGSLFLVLALGGVCLMLKRRGFKRKN